MYDIVHGVVMDQPCLRPRRREQRWASEESFSNFTSLVLTVCIEQAKFIRRRSRLTIWHIEAQVEASAIVDEPDWHKSSQVLVNDPARSSSAVSADTELRSWVTSINVFPRSRHEPQSRSMTFCAFSSSRFPVGSSARTRSGSLARALAIATRCCSPPLS